MDILVAILIFIGVVIVSVLFFGGWLIVSIVRLLARAMGGGRTREMPPPREAPVRLPPPPQRLLCGHDNCRAANDPGARFCSRCGRPLAGRDRAVVRRVAMW